jgi:hypothetical protein
MRVRGKVVGNTVVLDSPLPEGAEVEVVLDADRTVDVTDAEWESLVEAAAQARRGQVVSAESVLEKLRAAQPR